MRPKADRIGISANVPKPLAEWLDAEASARGMNRNQFINYTLQMARECQTVDRICRLEKRVLHLESLALLRNSGAIA